MKRIACLVIAVATVAGVATGTAPASGQADGAVAPIFGIKILPGYRDWILISVAHVGGNLNDLRVKLGNDVAIKAYREGKLPFPDGTIIARLAYRQVKSEQDNKVLRGILERRFSPEETTKFLAESIVAGPATNVQFIVKDSRKYASTSGWASLNSPTANLTARRCTKPAFPVTSPPKIATLSSPVRHLNDRAP